MPAKVLIFDVDGILCNTDEVYFAELRRALKAENISIDETFYAEHGYDDCINDLHLSEEQKQRVLRAVHERYYSDDILQYVQLKPDVQTTLARLFPTFRLATGSGETKLQILRYLTYFGIADYFTFIGHGGLVEGRKSNPEYFSLIARHYGISTSECLHIGDTLTDQRALDAGVPIVIIPTKYSAHIAFDPRCHLLKKISDLPDFLEKQHHAPVS